MNRYPEAEIVDKYVTNKKNSYTVCYFNNRCLFLKCFILYYTWGTETVLYFLNSHKNNLGTDFYLQENWLHVVSSNCVSKNLL